MTRTITLSDLTKYRACASQVELFAEHFPEGVEISALTIPALVAQFSGLFDWDWVARRLLSTPARAEHDKVCDLAAAEFNKVCDPAYAEYDKVCALARTEYEKVRDPAYAEFNKVCATAFLILYAADTPHV